jgi:hypothetical protein
MGTIGRVILIAVVARFRKWKRAMSSDVIAIRTPLKRTSNLGQLLQPLLASGWDAHDY